MSKRKTIPQGKRRPTANSRAKTALHRAAWPTNIPAVLAAAALGALVWIGFPGAPPISTFAYPAPVPVLAWCAQTVVVGVVIGTTLSCQPATLKTAQAISASLLAGTIAWLLAPFLFSASAVVACLASGLASVLIASKMPRKFGWALGMAVLAILFAMMAISSGVLPGPMHPAFVQGVANYWNLTPQVARYEFDTYVFMRAAQLMRSGTGYYPAFVAALKADTRHLPLSSPFNFRPPLVIWVWSWLPMHSMGDLKTYALGVGALCAIIAFLIAAEFVQPGIAVVAAVLVSRLYAVVCINQSPWLGITEFWVAPIGLLGLWLTLRRQWIAAALALCVAILGREMMVLLLPAWFVALYLRAEMPPMRKHACAGGAAFVAVLCLGMPYWIASHFTEGVGKGLSPWLNGGPIRLFQDLTLHARGPGIDAITVWPSVLILAVAIVAIASIPSKWRLATAGAAVGVYTLFLGCVSGGDASFYWGVPYLIILMTFTPVIATRFAPSDSIVSESIHT